MTPCFFHVNLQLAAGVKLDSWATAPTFLQDCQQQKAAGFRRLQLSLTNQRADFKITDSLGQIIIDPNNCL